MRVRSLAQLVCLRVVYGQIKSSGSSRSGHSSCDKRVFCHDALHLKQKLQSASYSQAVVEWNSDSE